jgi:hypothetical protein
MADTRHPTYIPSPLLHQCRIMLELTGVARIVRIIIVPPFLGYSRHVTCVPTLKPLPKGKANGKPCCFACTKPTSYANRIASSLSPLPPLVIQWLPFAIQSVYFLRGFNFTLFHELPAVHVCVYPGKRIVLPLHF